MTVASDVDPVERYIGQLRVSSTRQCHEVFLSFDTSSVVGTIQSATLSLYGQSDASTTDFTIEARLQDWGTPPVTGADWVAGASLSGLTLLASLATSGGFVVGYNDLVSEAAFAASINQSGFTRLLLHSSRLRVGNDPSGSEAVVTEPFDAVGKQAKLVVVTT